MKKIYTFPSVFEESNVDLPNVATTFLEGMRITDQAGKSYIVGNLALSEGTSPHKFLNSSSNDFDYRILSLVSMVLATQGKHFRFNITTGFPFVTYLSYRDAAVDFLKKRHQISIDTRTFGGEAVEKINVNVDSVNIMSEVEGCIKAIRDGETQEKESFFITSLGFGTFEAALSTGSGFVNRTAVSSRGISYAVNLLEKELQKDYYISLMTEQQLERAFQRGMIIIDRQRIDLTKMRAKVLEVYYNEVISPSLRKKFSNSDFMDTSKLYLVGGGAFYPELVDQFKKEFNNILDIIVYPEPHLCAGIGYCLNSIEKYKEAQGNSENFEDIAYVGIDLGNSNTVVVVETIDVEEPKVAKHEVLKPAHEEQLNHMN